MSKKAILPSGEVVRQNLSITTELLEKAKARAEGETGGNLSRYIQSLIERDLAPASTGKSPLVDFVREHAGTSKAEAVRAMLHPDAGNHAAVRAEYDAAVDELRAMIAEKRNPALVHPRSIAAKEALAKTVPLPFSEHEIASAIAAEIPRYLEELVEMGFIGFDAKTNSLLMMEGFPVKGAKRLTDDSALRRRAPRIIPVNLLDTLYAIISRLEGDSDVEESKPKRTRARG